MDVNGVLWAAAWDGELVVTNGYPVRGACAELARSLRGACVELARRLRGAFAQMCASICVSDIHVDLSMSVAAETECLGVLVRPSSIMNSDPTWHVPKT